MGQVETLATWAEEWLATTIHLKPRTRLSYETVLRHRLLPAFGAVPVGEISQRDVKRFVADLVEAGDAPGTVHRAYELLRNLLNGAFDAGLIKTNPCRRVRLPRSPHHEMHFLEPPEVLALSRAIHPRFRLMILFAAYTGARAGEIGALRVGRAHTCVALLIAQGAHPRAIMERLGHSTIEMTLGRYGHLFPGLDAELVDGMERMFRAAGWSPAGEAA